MTPIGEHKTATQSGKSQVIAAIALGAVLIFIVAYRLRPKHAESTAPALSAAGQVDTDAGLDADEVDLMPLLATLDRPLPEPIVKQVTIGKVTRDPFRAAGRFREAIDQLAAQQNAATAPQAPAERPEEILSLKGILHDENGAVACINGSMLSVGDVILGFTVRAIGQWDVTLEKQGKSVVLALPIKRLVEGN